MKMDLFSQTEDSARQGRAPLAARMRPQNLDEIVGQEHLLGRGKLLRRAIETDQLGSLVFYGPPGTGKTTLAYVIAKTTKAHFTKLNAVTSGVADLRKVVQEAEERAKYYRQGTLLFIDEIHRFNKAQQDALLPAVEEGKAGLNRGNYGKTLISALMPRWCPVLEFFGWSLCQRKIFSLCSGGRLRIRKGGLGKLSLCHCAGSFASFGGSGPG
jgi:hypothetical protein